MDPERKARYTMRARRVGKISAAAAGFVVLISELTPGCSARVQIPETNWGIRAGTSIGKEDELEKPLEAFIIKDVCERSGKTSEECAPENGDLQDAFINWDFPPSGEIHRLGILGSFAVGEEPEGVNPVDFDFHIAR